MDGEIKDFTIKFMEVAFKYFGTSHDHNDEHEDTAIMFCMNMIAVQVGFVNLEIWCSRRLMVFSL